MFRIFEKSYTMFFKDIIYVFLKNFSHIKIPSKYMQYITVNMKHSVVKLILNNCLKSIKTNSNLSSFLTCSYNESQMINHDDSLITIFIIYFFKK